MPKTQIAFFDLSPEEKDFFHQVLSMSEDFSTAFHRSALSPRSLESARDAEIAVISIRCRIDAATLAKLPHLRLIATLSTGFDHIDLESCRRRGITVCNVPTYGEQTVAEHTFALLLSLSRKIPQSIEHVQRLDFRLHDLRGFDLAGKTLGLVGLGHIGGHVARIARGFDMRIIASDPRPDRKLLEKYDIRLLSLEKLLQRSDIISLHAPYNEHTHHLLHRGNIDLIKPGAYLLNTARGGLIETAALLEALENGIIAGAGLDVLEEENSIREEKELLQRKPQDNRLLSTVLESHLLLHNPRVIITAHNAFNSEEALQRILDTTLLNIRKFAMGKPINVIKYP